MGINTHQNKTSIDLEIFAFNNVSLMMLSNDNQKHENISIKHEWNILHVLIHHGSTSTRMKQCENLYIFQLYVVGNELGHASFIIACSNWVALITCCLYLHILSCINTLGISHATTYWKSKKMQHKTRNSEAFIFFSLLFGVSLI